MPQSDPRALLRNIQGQSLPQLQPRVGRREEEEPEKLFGVVDTLLGVPRGIVSAVDESLDLVDALDDHTFDLFDDIDLRSENSLYQRVLGDPRTTSGRMALSVSQFLTGFIPIAGWLGKAKWAGALTTASQQAANTLKGAYGVQLARGAVAGAITDFTVYDGAEERVANLIQNTPALANPVFEWLAADPEDGFAEGRFKNALEGMGLGVFFDSLGLVIRGVRAGRLAKSRGQSAKGAWEGVIRGGDELMKQRKALRKDLSRPLISDLEGQDVLPPVTSGRVLERILKGRGQKEHEFVSDIVKQYDVRTKGGPESLSPRGKSKMELLELSLDVGDLNFEWFEDVDAATWNRAFYDLARKTLREIPDMRGKTLTEEEAAAASKLAYQIDGTPGTFVGNAMSLAKDAEDAAVEVRAAVLAGRWGQQLSAQRTMKAIADLNKPGADTALYLRIVGYVKEHAELTAHMQGLASEVGRSLRLFGATVRNLKPAEVLEEIASLGGEKKLVQFVEKIASTATAEDPLRALSVLANSPTTRGVDILNEYWINAILSGPRTLSLNFISNSLITLFRPLARVTGGAINATTSAAASVVPGQTYDPRHVQEIARNIRMMYGLVKAVPESFKQAGKAFLKGQAALDPAFQKIELRNRQAFSARGFEEATGIPLDNTAVGNTITFFGRWAVGWSGKVLASTDEWFKQLNFRASLYADLSGQAVEKGKFGPEAADWITNQFDLFIRDGAARESELAYKEAYNRVMSQLERLEPPRSKRGAGAFKEKELRLRKKAREEARRVYDVNARGLEDARRNTFTQELEPGTFARGVSNLVAQHPWGRQIVPFVRTPTNLLSEGLAHLVSPVVDTMGILRRVTGSNAGKALKDSSLKMMRQHASNDPRVRAEVIGRLSASLGFYTFVSSKIADGTITGRGPKNPAQRAVMEDAGWQEYSIQLFGKWVSYKRLDPFATVLGTIADVYQFATWADRGYNDSVEDASAAVMAALANNFTNKSFLTGISNVVNALEDPEGFMPSFVRRHVGSFVPNILAQSVDMSSPTMKEARGIIDVLMSRVPGLSDALEPKRNFIGEPMQKTLLADRHGGVANWFSPIATSRISDDAVNRELINLAHGFEPPSETRAGVDLVSIKTSEVMTRVLDIPIYRTAYDHFSELVSKTRINGRTLRASLKRLIATQHYQRASFQTDVEGKDAPRVDKIQKLVNQYRRRAFKQAQRDIPELRTEIRKAIRRSRELEFKHLTR